MTWIDKVTKIANGLRRVGIHVWGGDEYKLAAVLAPSPLGKLSAWVAKVEQTSLGRYVSHVRCRRCSHSLRLNQRSWMFTHQLKCGGRTL